MKTPDFLVIGHVTQDTIIHKNINLDTFGGTALYSALLSKKLGLNVAVVTSASKEFPFKKILQNFLVKNIVSEYNTKFENNYIENKRIQYIKSSAKDIDFSFIPKEWLDCKIILLAPIFKEFISFSKIFKEGFVGCNLQGWIRDKDVNGKIHFIQNWEDIDLSGLDLVIFSNEDIKKEFWEYFALKVKYVAVTCGANGVYISESGEWSHIPGYNSNLIDSTGAGDVWASAFMIFFCETADLLLSAKMANAAASLSIEGFGYSKIPNRSEIEEKFSQKRISD